MDVADDRVSVGGFGDLLCGDGRCKVAGNDSCAAVPVGPKQHLRYDRRREGPRGEAEVQSLHVRARLLAPRVQDEDITA